MPHYKYLPFTEQFLQYALLLLTKSLVGGDQVEFEE